MYQLLFRLSHSQEWDLARRQHQLTTHADFIQIILQIFEWNFHQPMTSTPTSTSTPLPWQWSYPPIGTITSMIFGLQYYPGKFLKCLNREGETEREMRDGKRDRGSWVVRTTDEHVQKGGGAMNNHGTPLSTMTGKCKGVWLWFRLGIQTRSPLQGGTVNDHSPSDHAHSQTHI